MIPINPQRLIDDLKTLRAIGASGTGVVRPAFSADDMAARRWLVDRCKGAGLISEIDGAGNVFGRSRKPGPALLVGSHSDTQPQGGWLDGALGVIYGLEIARALGDGGLAIDVVSWMDEEGIFLGSLGSRVCCGELDLADLADTRSRDGRALGAAIEDAGLAGRPARLLDETRYRGYLEAHIEQGPRLEASGLRLGIVTSIVGLRDLTISFTGQQNHAGTTPMALRKDAGAALIRFAADIQADFPALAGPDTVWTVGMVEFSTGARSIIPGAARMALQFRDPDSEVLDRLERHVMARADADAPVSVSVTVDDRIPGTPMDPDLQDHLEAAAGAVAPGLWSRMPSGAAHDAQILAAHVPSAMLFIPSIGGISHSFEEDSAEADIILGCQALAEAAHSILTGART